jgi:hypothetical protein
MKNQEFIERTAEEEFSILKKYKGAREGARFREYLKENGFVSKKYTATDGEEFIGWTKEA